jgi:hypothetical protein
MGHFGHVGRSIGAVKGHLSGAFVYRQGRLPYTQPMEAPYGRSVGDVKLLLGKRSHLIAIRLPAP